MKKLCLLVLGAALLFSCTQPAAIKEVASTFNLDSVKAAIEANNAVLIKAIQRRRRLDVVPFLPTQPDGQAVSRHPPRSG